MSSRRGSSAPFRRTPRQHSRTSLRVSFPLAEPAPPRASGRLCPEEFWPRWPRVLRSPPPPPTSSQTELLTSQKNMLDLEPWRDHHKVGVIPDLDPPFALFQAKKAGRNLGGQRDDLLEL